MDYSSEACLNQFLLKYQLDQLTFNCSAELCLFRVVDLINIIEKSIQYSYDGRCIHKNSVVVWKWDDVGPFNFYKGLCDLITQAEDCLTLHKLELIQ